MTTKSQQRKQMPSQITTNRKRTSKSAAIASEIPRDRADRANRLREFIDLHYKSHAEFGRATRLTPAQISGYISAEPKNNRDCGAETLIRMAEGGDLSPLWYLFGVTPMSYRQVVGQSPAVTSRFHSHADTHPQRQMIQAIPASVAKAENAQVLIQVLMLMSPEARQELLRALPEGS